MPFSGSLLRSLDKPIHLKPHLQSQRIRVHRFPPSTQVSSFQQIRLALGLVVKADAAIDVFVRVS